MTIADSMSTEPITCSPTATVQQAARLMTEHSVGSVIVVDDEHRPIGIVTDRDLALRVVGSGRDSSIEVAQVMTADPVTIAPNVHVTDAAAHLATRGCRRLPVVDIETGRLVGVVSLDDLLLSTLETVDQIARLLAEERSDRMRG
jgi:CBS domain-containing protein